MRDPVADAAYLDENASYSHYIDDNDSYLHLCYSGANASENDSHLHLRWLVRG